MRTFKDEFEDLLDPITIGRVNRADGSWTEEHVTVGFFETLSGRQVWIAEQAKVQFSHRVFLPNEDNEGNVIVLDSNLFIVQSGDFDWKDSDGIILYQVQERQPFDYYQYALVRAVDI